MRPEIVMLALAVGACTWAFRALPFRFDLTGLTPEGWLSRLLAATGPAAIAALFAVSVLPLVQGVAPPAPLGAGLGAVIGLWLWRRSVVLATLGGALAYGAVFAL